MNRNKAFILLLLPLMAIPTSAFAKDGDFIWSDKVKKDAKFTFKIEEYKSEDDEYWDEDEKEKVEEGQKYKVIVKENPSKDDWVKMEIEFDGEIVNDEYSDGLEVQPLKIEGDYDDLDEYADFLEEILEAQGVEEFSIEWDEDGILKEVYMKEDSDNYFRIKRSKILGFIGNEFLLGMIIAAISIFGLASVMKRK